MHSTSDATSAWFEALAFKIVCCLQAMRQKQELVAQQYARYDKWCKEVEKQKDIVRR
jgi:hypothetical protein